MKTEMNKRMAEQEQTIKLITFTGEKMFNPPEELLQKKHASNVSCLRCCCGEFSVFGSRFNLDVNKRGAKIETRSF